MTDVTRVGVALLLVAATAGRAAAQQDRATNPSLNEVQLSAWLQPRYEHSWNQESEIDDLYFRRLRIDVRGRLIHRGLRFRIQADLLRQGALRDAYLDYTIHDRVSIRAGKYSVPFGWRVSPRRDPFTERDLATSEFGGASRDIGVLVHGRSPDGRLEYASGLMDGSGAKGTRSLRPGMLTVRTSYALVGVVPEDETDPTRSVAGNVAVGVGAQAAWNNVLEDWSLGRSGVGETAGNWGATVLDAVAQRRGLSAVVKYYFRVVDPIDSAIEPYRGSAVALLLAAAPAPSIELVGRVSHSGPDTADPAFDRSGWSLGLNLYHRGHRLKSRLHYRSETATPPAPAEHVLAADFSMQLP